MIEHFPMHTAQLVALAKRCRGNRAVAAVAATLMALLCILPGAAAALANADAVVVRLAMVNVPDDVVRPLLEEFATQSGMRADIVYTGNDPFAVAREGKADLVRATKPAATPVSTATQ